MTNGESATGSQVTLHATSPEQMKSVTPNSSNTQSDPLRTEVGKLPGVCWTPMMKHKPNLKHAISLKEHIAKRSSPQELTAIERHLDSKRMEESAAIKAPKGAEKLVKSRVPRSSKFASNQRIRAAEMARTGLAKLFFLARGRIHAEASAAANELVNVLITAVGDLSEELRSEDRKLHTDSLRKVLEESITWPVNWVPTPRDQKMQANELRGLGFGLRPPINVKSATQPSAGTTFARQYWRFVVHTKRTKALGRLRELKSKEPNNTAYLDDALGLPSLSRDPETLRQWSAACIRYFEFREQLAPSDIPKSWENLKPAKIRERIRDGIRQIAPG